MRRVEGSRQIAASPASMAAIAAQTSALTGVVDRDSTPAQASTGNTTRAATNGGRSAQAIAQLAASGNTSGQSSASVSSAPFAPRDAIHAASGASTSAARELRA